MYAGEVMHIIYSPLSAPTDFPVNAGTYEVLVSASNGHNYSQTYNVKVGEFTIAKATPHVGNIKDDLGITSVFNPSTTYNGYSKDAFVMYGVDKDKLAAANTKYGTITLSYTNTTTTTTEPTEAAV